MIVFEPGYELLDAIVKLLRNDATMTALLFSVTSRINAIDDRVYESMVELPDDELRQVLPRVLVDVATLPRDYEQKPADPAKPQVSASVDLITLVDADYRELGESLYARECELIGSTPLEDSHIICAELVPEGLRRPVREVAFRNAWRFTASFRSQLVGVK